MRIAFLAVVYALALSLSGFASANQEGPTPEDVAFAQGLVERMGYDPGPQDGICGNQTTSALRAFHDDHGLPLEPGHIEPQAATVVKNLTDAFANAVMAPSGPTSKVYREALKGDPDSAKKIGMMYHRGYSVPADKMMAFLWWSVAEANGASDAGKLKENLLENGGISDHEMGFAKSLAEKISQTACNDSECKIPRNDRQKPGTTM